MEFSGNRDLSSAYYSSETTQGIVMKLHICIGMGLKMVLNEICSDWKNKMAARQPFWIFNKLNYHIIEKSCYVSISLKLLMVQWWNFTHVCVFVSIWSSLKFVVIKKTRWPPGSHLEFSFIWIIFLTNKDIEKWFSPNGSLSDSAPVSSPRFWCNFKNEEMPAILNFKI